MRGLMAWSAAILLLTCGCNSPKGAERYASGPVVRFVRDTLIEKVHLPVNGEPWSPSGRSFIAESQDGILVMDAANPGRRSFYPISAHQRSFAWSPGDSVLACYLRFGAWSTVLDSVRLVWPGQAREVQDLRADVGSLLWLPTGALVVAGVRGEYAVLRPGSSPATADTCDRVWAVHLDWSRGSHGFAGLVPTICAPASSSPIPGVPGWSRVAFQGEAYPWMWWAPKARHFVTQWSDEGLRHYDAMGRILDARPPREPVEVVYTLGADGEVAIGRVNPNPDSEEGPSPCPAYAWSGDGSWRSPIAGLDGGIFGASAAPVGDRILFQTKRGLELGRLVIEK